MCTSRRCSWHRSPGRARGASDCWFSAAPCGGGGCTPGELEARRCPLLPVHPQRPTWVPFWKFLKTCKERCHCAQRGTQSRSKSESCTGHPDLRQTTHPSSHDASAFIISQVVLPVESTFLCQGTPCPNLCSLFNCLFSLTLLLELISVLSGI